MSKAPRSETSKPLSVRFTDSEKSRLQELAGSRPVGHYIRERALQGDALPRATRHSPVRDAEPLARLLGLLGQSRLSSNLNQLAKAAHNGSLPVTEEVESDLRRACADIFAMRNLLLQALGLQIIGQIEGITPATDFAETAGGSAE